MALFLHDYLATDLTSIEKRFSTAMPYVWGLSSAIFLTVTNLFIKQLSKDFSTVQVLFFRSLSLAFFIYLFMRTENLQFHYKSVIINRLLFMRAAVGTIGAGVIYYGVMLLPLSDAMVILQVYPVFTGALATLVLGERYEKSQLYAALICLIGVIMIAQPPALFGERESETQGESYSRVIGTLALLLGGLSSAGVEVLVKKVGGKTNVGIATLVFAISAAIIGSFLSLWTGFNPLQWHHVPLLVCIGLLSFGSQISKNRAFVLSKNAGRVSNTSYFGIVTSYFIDIVVLGNEVNPWSLLGGLCILSCMVIYIFKLYNEEKKAKITSRI